MQNKNELRKLKDELKSLEKHLNIALSLVRGLEDAEKKSFEDIPGKVGIFDGEFMVTESGEKFPVPANYAAKSQLLFGDEMKMVEEEGKPFFKNISKSNPKEIHGVLSKKEDVWYILADCGSYRISDTAASFNEAKHNAKAVALIPEGNVKAPFAALKKVIKEDEKSKPIMPAPEKPLDKEVTEKKVSVSKPERVGYDKKVIEHKPMGQQKKEPPKPQEPATVTMDEDDLR